MNLCHIYLEDIIFKWLIRQSAHMYSEVFVIISTTTYWAEIAATADHSVTPVESGAHIAITGTTGTTGTTTVATEITKVAEIAKIAAATAATAIVWPNAHAATTTHTTIVVVADRKIITEIAAITEISVIAKVAKVTEIVSEIAATIVEAIIATKATVAIAEVTIVAVACAKITVITETTETAAIIAITKTNSIATSIAIRSKVVAKVTRVGEVWQIIEAKCVVSANTEWSAIVTPICVEASKLGHFKFVRV